MLKKENNKIPIGEFCYEITAGPQFNEDGKAFFEAKCCPYYKHCGGIEGKCMKFNEVIYDQTKICNINTLDEFKNE